MLVELACDHVGRIAIEKGAKGVVDCSDDVLKSVPSIVKRSLRQLEQALPREDWSRDCQVVWRAQHKFQG